MEESEVFVSISVVHFHWKYLYPNEVVLKLGVPLALFLFSVSSRFAFYFSGQI